MTPEESIASAVGAPTFASAVPTPVQAAVLPQTQPVPPPQVPVAPAMTLRTLQLPVSATYILPLESMMQAEGFLYFAPAPSLTPLVVQVPVVSERMPLLATSLMQWFPLSTMKTVEDQLHTPCGPFNAMPVAAPVLPLPADPVPANR